MCLQTYTLLCLCLLEYLLLPTRAQFKCCHFFFLFFANAIYFWMSYGKEFSACTHNVDGVRE